jgi:tryptophanyl-tRNA synthetase
MNKEIIVSGMRTTGALHLGHLHGVLKNWIALQENYECYFFAADQHALTTRYEDPSVIAAATREMFVDWLAVGVSPEKATLFVQSQVKQHAELFLLLSMIAPLGWLERVPTYKEQLQKLSGDLNTYGFLGYPVLMAADILLYDSTLVPVGDDQVAHLELVRELARRFNHLYGKENVLLKEPKPLLTKASKLLGLDGQKMSKSYDNTIKLREPLIDVENKIKKMPTDPARVKRSDPGDPKKCPVYAMHEVYSDEACKAWVREGCTTAGIGCLDCKKPLLKAVQAELAPIQDAIARLEKDQDTLTDIMKAGAQKAAVKAEETIVKVKSAMGLLT